MRGCAWCGRPLRETASWKGRGDRFYCSEFCADVEPVDEPVDLASLLPEGGTPALARASRKVAGLGFRDRLTASSR